MTAPPEEEEQVCVAMRLHSGQADEYRRRHDAIWPELAVLLRDSGILDYRIYLDAETGTLLSVVRRDATHRMDDLARSPVMRRWWRHMADIMDTEPDGAPRASPLPEMFRLQ